jgi:hypothetical protein
MKKLDDIPKNHPFKVPDGYFDRLPGIIQARIAEKSEIKESRPYFRYALQYALPAIALVIVAVIYLVPRTPETVESMLATVSTEEIVAYLEESEITADELLESMDLNAENVEAIESELYLNLDDLENLNELESELNNL